MIDLPFFSKILSSLDWAAFGCGAETTVHPILSTISSLARVISSPTATTREITTAERLLLRALDNTKRLPKYPAKIELPLKPIDAACVGMKVPEGFPLRPIHSGRAVPLIVGTTTPARQMARGSSSGNSVRPSPLQIRKGAVVSRWVQSGGVSPAPEALNIP